MGGRASWKGGKTDETKDVFGVVEIEEEGVKMLLVVPKLKVEAVKVEAEYVLVGDEGLLAGKCENEALVGEDGTAVFLFNPSLGVGEGQFDRNRGSWGGVRLFPFILPQGQPPRQIRHNSQLLHPFHKLPMRRNNVITPLPGRLPQDIREFLDEIIPRPVVCARRQSKVG